MTIRMAPSILAADFARLADAITMAEAGGADLIHVDVMDGHFVPNISVGPPVVASLNGVAHVPLDVHLMIEDADRYIPDFAKAGASMISVHVEALPHLHRTIGLIHELGLRAGVAINPGTAVSTLTDIAADVDFVLVMTVNPGFGGQTFIPRSTSKVRAVRAVLDAVGNPAPIEVDGGIDATTVPAIVSAGAEILVAGSAVFGSPDPAASIRTLRQLAEAAAARAAGSGVAV